MTSDKQKNETTMLVSSSWRDDTVDGKLQTLKGDLNVTEQPGTFIYDNPYYTFTCK